MLAAPYPVPVQYFIFSIFRNRFRNQQDNAASVSMHPVHSHKASCPWITARSVGPAFPRNAATYIFPSNPNPHCATQPRRRKLPPCRANDDPAGRGDDDTAQEQSQQSQQSQQSRQSQQSQQPTPPPAQAPQQPRKPQRQADSTDAISSALTRRFGLAGGLAWLGFLTFGVVSEQIKTRLEVAAEERDTKSVAQRTLEKIPGTTITYTDEKIGGGARPQQGDLVVLNLKGYAIVDGEMQLFVDTSDTGKPIVLVYKSRPFTAGNSLGVELALEDMRAGGRRHVNVPSQYGFAEKSTSLKPSRHVPDKASVVPPNADLEYDLELLRVSIPPS